ncbi:MAG: GNAT family N-acetyltransferase [Candidatus Marinimicrobia bacterium]|nr:GNAT family N-acetyltransferase [Candidatus Neomarinimicrobiota bacterium]
MYSPFISGEKIDLCPVSKDYMEILQKGYNDPDVRDAMFMYFPLTEKDTENKIEAMLKDEKAINLIIVDKETEKPIGHTALVHPDWVSGMVTFYIVLLDKAVWGKGFGSEATKLIVDYGFNMLNLNRIQLHVNAENEAAKAVYKKIGFKYEGTLRQAMYKNNKYHDFWLMSVIAEEYKAKAT